MTVKHTETYDGTTITYTYEADTVYDLINLMQELQKERRRSEEQDRIRDRPKPARDAPTEITSVRRLRAWFVGEVPTGVEVGSRFRAYWVGPKMDENFDATFLVLSSFGGGELVSDGCYNLPRSWPWPNSRDTICVNTPFGWHTLVVREEVDRVEITTVVGTGGPVGDRAPATPRRAAPGGGEGNAPAGERVAGPCQREPAGADPQQHGGGFPGSTGQRDGDGGGQGAESAGVSCLRIETVRDEINRRIHELEHALESACAALEEHNKEYKHVTPAEVIATWKRLARRE